MGNLSPSNESDKIPLAADRSYIDITLNQIKTVLGLLTFNATADAGITVQGTIWGK